MTDGIDRTDPICGMRGTIAAHGRYFCSKHCVEVYGKRMKNKDVSGMTESKLPVVLLVSFLLIGMVASIFYRPLMLPFMGFVLLVLGILKVVDLRGFAQAYQMYDLISRSIPAYAFVYPFLEIVLGLLFLLQVQLTLAALVLAVLMVVGILSVLLELRTGRKLQCACMGTWIKVPLTTLTLVEDLVMLVMAGMILLAM